MHRFSDPKRARRCVPSLGLAGQYLRESGQVVIAAKDRQMIVIGFCVTRCARVGNGVLKIGGVSLLVEIPQFSRSGTRGY